jgi:hypothetical protein
MSARPAAEGVAIPGVILRFLESASIAYAATRDAGRVPSIHWVCGWLCPADPRLLAFLVSEPFTASFLANVKQCPRIALTVEQIGSHETYQFKGEFAGAAPVGPPERVAFEGCRARFVRDVRALDMRHEFSPETLERYMGEPSLAVSLRVHEIFRQTPGPGAGARLVPSEGA